MNLLAELRQRFAAALESFAAERAKLSAVDSSAVDIPELIALVRPSQDAKFGDYQANLAMPLGKRLGLPPRDVAAAVIERLAWDDLCETPAVAGPGFINLRIRHDRLAALAQAAADDERLGVVPSATPRTIVLDYSAPNVAKPMHVGHIRSTVIGDSLYRTLRFLGHRVIGDNHIGDWGTQFGMIIYGYRSFRDEAAYRARPVDELSRLYRLVNQLVDYQAAKQELPALTERIAAAAAELEQRKAETLPFDKKEAKKAAQALGRSEAALKDLRDRAAALATKIEAVERDAGFAQIARDHADIGQAVLAETAKLHAGDAENLRLWREFMPACLDAIETVYERLGVRFDMTLGESFYHDRLAAVVDDLVQRGIATESDGAICVFVPDAPAPMIVRKKDGAFLYATSDLATIQYRMQEWSPESILYVVDHRQSLHFEQLFATARRWGYDRVEFQHISFGTVLGDDGRPFKTRSGDTVGLTGLLDEAVARAHAIVCENDDAKPGGAELSREERVRVAERVGIAALKYADLSQNRTTDYTFSYDKMLAMNGNTATYMQYAYARVRSIFRRGEVDVEALRAAAPAIHLTEPAERALALAVLRLAEALDAVVADYRPNQLTTYLFELAGCYATFFEQCPVLKAPDEPTRQSRLLLCDLTARTVAKGLALLGIDVVEQM